MNKTPATRNPALRLLLLLLVSIALLGSGAPERSHPRPSAERNLRPVIGVFSQQTDTVTSSSTIDSEVKAELEAYRYLIPASYVSWIGQAGGRVLPILLNQPDAYCDEVFARTNGILFPGDRLA